VCTWQHTSRLGYRRAVRNLPYDHSQGIQQIFLQNIIRSWNYPDSMEKKKGKSFLPKVARISIHGRSDAKTLQHWRMHLKGSNSTGGNRLRDEQGKNSFTERMGQVPAPHSSLRLQLCVQVKPSHQLLRNNPCSQQATQAFSRN